MTERRGELRRDWTIIVAAGTGACAGITGLAFYTFGLFVKPLGQSFGWSRGQISLGLSCITLGTILCAPVVGWLIDRFGVRRVASPSLLGLAAAFAGLAAISAHIATFYLASFLLAVLGCATSPVTWTRAISMTFHQSRGLALGLSLLGSALAGLVGAPLIQGVIAQTGWRAAYLSMAAFVALIAFPMVLFLLRERDPSAMTSADARWGIPLRAAICTAPFWTLGSAIVILITAQSGVIVHLVPLLTDRGVPSALAATLVGVMGVSILISRWATGALLDRQNPAAVAGLVLLAPAVAAAILASCGDRMSFIVVAILLLGLSAGAEIDLLSFFTSRYFGLQYYGQIYGVLFAMFSLGNGLGAPLMGAAFDRWHSYTLALFIASGLFALGSALFASLAFYPAPSQGGIGRLRASNVGRPKSRLT